MKINKVTQEAIQEIEILNQQLNQSVSNQLIQSQIIFQHLLNIEHSNHVTNWVLNIIKEDIIDENIKGGKQEKQGILQLTQASNRQFKQLQGVYYLDRQDAGSYFLNFNILKTLFSTILNHIKDFANEWNYV